MSQGSSLMLDSFWHAAAYCFRPKVIALSLVPLVVMLLVLGGWSYFYWTASVAAVQHWVETIGWLRTMFSWFGGSGTEGIGGQRFGFLNHTDRVDQVVEHGHGIDVD